MEDGYEHLIRKIMIITTKNSVTCTMCQALFSAHNKPELITIISISQMKKLRHREIDLSRSDTYGFKLKQYSANIHS